MADLTLCLDLLHRQAQGGGGGAGAMAAAAAAAAGGGASTSAGGGAGGLCVSAGRCLFSRRLRVLQDLEGMQPRPDVHVFRMEDVEVREGGKGREEKEREGEEGARGRGGGHVSRWDVMGEYDTRGARRRLNA